MRCRRPAGTIHLFDGDLGNKATMFIILMQYNIRIHDTEYRGGCGDALARGVFGMATRGSWSSTAGEARPPHGVFLRCCCKAANERSRFGCSTPSDDGYFCRCTTMSSTWWCPIGMGLCLGDDFTCMGKLFGTVVWLCSADVAQWSGFRTPILNPLEVVSSSPRVDIPIQLG